MTRRPARVILHELETARQYFGEWQINPTSINDINELKEEIAFLERELFLTGYTAEREP
jgi:hypothetical protein